MCNFFAYYSLRSQLGLKKEVRSIFAGYCRTLANPAGDAVNKFSLADLARGDYYGEYSPDEQTVYYDKGAYVLDMLRRLMGDDLFFKAVHRLYTEHEIITTKDLDNIVNSVTGKDYSWFFNEWVYRPGFPNLTFDYQIIPKGKKKLIKVKIVQNGDLYHLNLPLVVNLEKEKKNFALKLSQKEGNWEFEVPDEIESIQLDPEYECFKYVYRLEAINRPYETKLKLARLKLDERKVSDVINYCNELLEFERELDDIQYAKLQLLLAQVLDLQGKREEAIKKYKEVLELEAAQEDIVLAKQGIEKAYK